MVLAPHELQLKNNRANSFHLCRAGMAPSIHAAELHIMDLFQTLQYYVLIAEVIQQSVPLFKFLGTSLLNLGHIEFPSIGRYGHEIENVPSLSCQFHPV